MVSRLILSRSSRLWPRPSPVIVMLYKGRDLGFEVLLEEVVFQQNAVLQRRMSAFDFPLCLRMAGSAVNLVDLVCLQPFTKIGSDVTHI